MNEIQRWASKVALVTGASSGIGSSIARRLSAHGLRVALLARREDRLQELARELPSERTLLLPADVRSTGQLLGAFERVREVWGGVDVLVNNAGLGYAAPLVSDSAPPKGAPLEERIEQWREMLEVNVLALCACTHEAVQDMRRRGGEGHVIHLSSLAGHRVTPGSSVYGASKVAVRWLTESLRLELAELRAPIRVTSISPGFVETEFHERYFESREQAQELYRTQTALSSEDVADAVEYALGTPVHVQVHDVLLRRASQRS